MKRPKKIYIFLPSFESGGVERNAVIFANALSARAYAVAIIYCREKSAWLTKLHSNVERIKLPRAKIPFLNERLVDAISMFLFTPYYFFRSGNLYERVVLGFQSSIVAIILAKITRSKVIARLSNHFSLIETESSMLRKCSEVGKIVTYRYADYVIANSNELAEDYGQKLKKKVFTVYNPIDFDRVKLLKSEKVGESDLLKVTKKIVITCGRLVYQKNVELLLLSFPNVLRQVDCELWVIGEGADRKNLEAKCVELGIENNVRFLGYKENPYKYMALADVFVLSSRYEGMPNVLIEAIATGLPVVSVKCKSGPTEILSEGRGGWLVPPCSSALLGEALVEALTKKSLTQSKLDYSSKQIKRYTEAKVVDTLEELVDNV